jgi:hypothetical protein
MMPDLWGNEPEKRRKRDLVFEALQEHCEIQNPLSKGQRGMLQRATRDLRGKCRCGAKAKGTVKYRREWMLLTLLNRFVPKMKFQCRKNNELGGLLPTYVADSWDRYAVRDKGGQLQALSQAWFNCHEFRYIDRAKMVFLEAYMADLPTWLQAKAESELAAMKKRIDVTAPECAKRFREFVDKARAERGGDE